MKHIISHRANLFGPNLQTENQIQTILNAIDKNFEVEIDLWFSYNDKKVYLGHDKPDIEIKEDFLFQYKDKLWIHCKNGEALSFCLKNKLRCFPHDQDDFTITSDQKIWRYPRTKLPYDKDLTIWVMPEYQNKLIKLDKYHDVLGVCTDFPYVFQFRLPLSLFSLYQSLENVYQSIVMKYSKLDKFSYDSSLLFDQNEEKKCFAAFSFYKPTTELDKLKDELSNIKNQNHILYDLTTTKNDKFNRGSIGRLHFTWLQLVSFDNIEKHGLLKDEEIKNLTFNPPINGEKKRRIVFHRVLMVPSGLILVGYPNFDIYDWRNQYRHFINNKKEKRFSEPYFNDIVHSTIVRWTSEINKKEIEKYIEMIDKYLPIELELEKSEDSIQFGYGTYKMCF